jgi:hypothetical protein
VNIYLSTLCNIKNILLLFMEEVGKEIFSTLPYSLQFTVCSFPSSLSHSLENKFLSLIFFEYLMVKIRSSEMGSCEQAVLSFTIFSTS